MVALLGNQRERFGQGEFFGQGKIEGDEDFTGSSSSFVLVLDLFFLWFRGRERGRRGLKSQPNALRRILAHGPSATTAVKLRHMRPEDFHVVANLRHRADRGTCGANRVALLDGDGGRDSFDAV